MLAQIQRAVAASEASAEEARLSGGADAPLHHRRQPRIADPLTTIRGFAELYRQGAAGDVETSMARIESESTRMGGLSRTCCCWPNSMPSARWSSVGGPVGAGRRRGSRCAIRHSDACGRHGVLDGPGPEVIGDEARLRQVLGNLVANAPQHTPAGAPVTVRVGTAGDDAVLEVADQGPGMQSQDAQRVFERFTWPTRPAPGPVGGRTRSVDRRLPGARPWWAGDGDHRPGPGLLFPGRPAAGGGGRRRNRGQFSSASAALIFACASSRDSADGLRSTWAKPKSLRSRAGRRARAGAVPPVRR